MRDCKNMTTNIAGIIASIALLTAPPSSGTALGEGDQSDRFETVRSADESARKQVAFFETLYGIKIEGVSPLEEYQDPDQFYSAIAQKVGIPEIAFKAVEKRFAWRRDGAFLIQTVVKGSWLGNEWGVMMMRIPKGIVAAKSVEEKRAFMKEMEMKFVLINYDGSISFPEEKKKPTKEESPKKE